MRTTVLYIVGVSRSGSTVVASALGAHADVSFVGEIGITPERGWRGDRVCSCGERWDECAFWTATRAGLDRRLGRHDVGRYAALRRRFEPYPLDARGWLRMARLAARPTRELEEYGTVMRAVFESVREASGRSIIVDSSKGPGRALALAMVPELDVVLVHVVRDARGVAYSMAKRFSKDVSKGIYHADEGESVLRSATLWSLTNGLSEIAGRAVPRRRFVRIRYEDFVADPGAALGRVGAAAGLDYREVERALVAGEPMSLGHILNGNRMRMSGAIRLEADREWERSLGRLERAKIQLSAGALLRRYGY